MALSLGASQKRALSMHVGHVILDFYDRNPPVWSEVGTVTQAELRRLVIERLKEKDCADVASMLETSSLDTTVEVIKKRFKTLREKKRREGERKRGAEKQAVLAAAALLRGLVQGCEEDPILSKMVQQSEEESVLSQAKAAAALLRGLVQGCEEDPILSKMVQRSEEESVLSHYKAAEALLRVLVQRCEEDPILSKMILPSEKSVLSHYKAAEALLRVLVQRCKEQSIASASDHLSEIYRDPEILPSEWFSPQTDHLLPPVIKTIVTILSEKPMPSWKSCDFFLVSDIMNLACGPTVEERAGMDPEVVRRSQVIYKTLHRLPSDLRPFGLWLLTFQSHQDILLKPLVYLEQADGPRNRSLCRLRTRLLDFDLQCGRDFNKKLKGTKEYNHFCSNCVLWVFSNVMAGIRKVLRLERRYT